VRIKGFIHKQSTVISRFGFDTIMVEAGTYSAVVVGAAFEIHQATDSFSFDLTSQAEDSWLRLRNLSQPLSKTPVAAKQFLLALGASK